MISEYPRKGKNLITEWLIVFIAFVIFIPLCEIFWFISSLLSKWFGKEEDNNAS